MKINFNKIISQDVLNFLDSVIVKTKGYDVYLGGGYLRDLFYNHLNSFGDYRNYYLGEDMDISINQVMYHPRSRLSYMTDAFTNSHEDKTIELLHKFETSRMIGRLNRMKEKFPDYELIHDIPQSQIDAYESKKEMGKRLKRRGRPSGSFIEE